MDSGVNGHDRGSPEPPEPSLPPTQPVSVVDPKEEEVLCEAFTDLHYQEMLRQASHLYPFDPNTIVGALSVPDALLASQPGHTQMPVPSSSVGNALVFRGEHNTSLLAVTLMNLSPQPTTNEVLHLVTNSTEANTRLLCQELDVLPGENVTVGTARKPVFMHDLHTHRGDPNVRYRALGTLDEARNDGDKYLMRCIDCLEADSYRQFPEPPIPSSIPLLILYFEHQVSSLVIPDKNGLLMFAWRICRVSFPTVLPSMLQRLTRLLLWRRRHKGPNRSWKKELADTSRRL